MKIAIASSGLGHVARGIETWALTLGHALAEREMDVTLFGGGKGDCGKWEVGGGDTGVQGDRCQVEGEEGEGERDCGRWDVEGGKGQGEEGESVRYKVESRKWGEGEGLTQRSGDCGGEEGTALDTRVAHVFNHGPGTPNQEPRTVVLPCLRRGARLTGLLVKTLVRLGGWRYGFGSEYQVEQETMAPALIRALGKGRFDVVHLQDPWLAWRLEQGFRKGRHPARVVLAHGTEESVEFLARFDHLQELSPPYAVRHERGRPIAMIPNFVDPAVFVSGDRMAAREALGMPRDALVVLSVGAINRGRKRMDWLADEVARLPDQATRLIVAGCVEGEDGRRLAKAITAQFGERVRVLDSVPHAEMPRLYDAADVFVLCALHELFGIAFLEAMACGVPCIGHTNPVTEWIIGDGGSCVDMEKPGALAAEIERYRDPDFRAQRGRAARERVMKMFAKDVVVDQIVGMYQKVVTGDR